MARGNFYNSDALEFDANRHPATANGEDGRDNEQRNRFHKSASLPDISLRVLRVHSQTKPFEFT
jgi:hypothetical protein